MKTQGEVDYQQFWMGLQQLGLNASRLSNSPPALAFLVRRFMKYWTAW